MLMKKAIVARTMFVALSLAALLLLEVLLSLKAHNSRD